jgi:hypothetical protein
MNDSHGSLAGKPTDRLTRGEVGAQMCVLSLPGVRSAEILEVNRVFPTLNGPVTGRPGDIAVTTASGETYPILSSIYYGTYEVIGEVGNQLAGRRLMHVRSAWRVISPDAQLNLPGRDPLLVERGGWLYQSDEDDFGLITEDVMASGHALVGTADEVTSAHWSKSFERLEWFLTALPPLLTLIALVALWAVEGSPIHWLPTALTSVETGLLLLGATAYAWAQIRGWEKKAAVTAGASAAQEFQPAAELLGERRSKSFPQMSLWRAAQASTLTPAKGLDLSPENVATLDSLAGRLAILIDEIKRKIRFSRRLESVGTTGAAIAVACVLSANIWLIGVSHWLQLELFALWLPSLIGAFHSLGYHRRAADQVPLLTEFARQLDFVKTKLVSLSKREVPEPEGRGIERVAALRLLCKVIGQYSQAELRLAIMRHPSLPV